MHAEWIVSHRWVDAVTFLKEIARPALSATTNGIVKLQAENADSTALTILDVITVDACDTVLLVINLNTVAIVGVWEAQAFSIEK